MKLLAKILHQKEYRTVAKNFGFLTILQVANYILPLIVLPYLGNVLGADKFGLLMFAQAFTQYFFIVVEYGFNFSATKDIARTRDSNEMISVFWNVMAAKLILLMVSIFALVAAVENIERLSAHADLYYFSALILVGSFLFPSWFFQGVEKMQYITIITLLSRVAAAVTTLIFVKGPEDIMLVPIFTGAFQILAGGIGFAYANYFLKFTFSRISLAKIRIALTAGRAIFWSAAATSLYQITNTFLLGILLGNAAAGYYSFAEKVVRAIASMFVPLNNALFPFMSKQMGESETKGISIVKKILKMTLVLTIIIAIGVIVGSEFLRYVIQPSLYPSINLIKALAPLLICLSVTNVLGFQVLLTTGNDGFYLRTVVLAGLMNVAFCIGFAPLMSFYSAVVAVTIAEVFICISFFWFSKRYFKL